MFKNVIKSSLVHKESSRKIIKFGAVRGAAKSPEEIKLEQTLGRLKKQVAETGAKLAQLTSETKTKVSSAQGEADKILSSSREEASDILRTAREESDRLLEQSRIDGFAEGLKRGEAEGLRKFDSVTVKITSLLDSIHKERERILKVAEKEVLELALGIARKIIHREVTLDPDIALENVKKAIEKVAAQKNIRILVSKKDFSEVASHRNELLTRLKGVDGVEIVEDSYIGPGGCLIEAELGNIDATVESQFEEMKRSLEEMVTAEEEDTDPSAVYDIKTNNDGPISSDLKKIQAEKHLEKNKNGKNGDKNTQPQSAKPSVPVTSAPPKPVQAKPQRAPAQPTTVAKPPARPAINRPSDNKPARPAAVPPAKSPQQPGVKPGSKRDPAKDG